MATQDRLTHLSGLVLQYAATEAELQELAQMSNNPVIMMRFASVLLIYAEAQARCTGAPNGEAYTAINTVRQRAGLRDLPAGRSRADFVAAVNITKAHYWIPIPGADAPVIPDL